MSKKNNTELVINLSGKTIGQWINEQRIGLKMSKYRLAKEIKCERILISHYENGKVIPAFSQVEKIYNVFKRISGEEVKS